MARGRGRPPKNPKNSQKNPVKSVKSKKKGVEVVTESEYESESSNISECGYEGGNEERPQKLRGLNSPTMDAVKGVQAMQIVEKKDVIEENPGKSENEDPSILSPKTSIVKIL